MKGAWRVLPPAVLFFCASLSGQGDRVVLSNAQYRHLEMGGLSSGAFGTGLFVSGGFDGTVLFHDANGRPSGAPLQLTGRPIDALLVLADGSLMASSAGRLFRRKDGRLVSGSVETRGSFVALAEGACPGADVCVLAGDDRGQVTLFAAETLRRIRSTEATGGGIRGLVALPRGGFATVADDGLLRVYVGDGKRPTLTNSLDAAGSSLALFADSSPKPPAKTADGKRAPEFLLACGTTRGELHLFELRTQPPSLHKRARLTLGGSAVSSLAFSAAGSEILAGFSGGRLVLVRLVDDSLRIVSRDSRDFEGHLERIVAVRSGATGWQTAGQEGLVRNWTADGRPLAPDYLGHRDAVWAVRFSGNILITGGGSEGLEPGIRRWSLEGVPQTPALRLGREEVTAIEVWPSGAFVVGTRDSRLHRFGGTLARPASVRLTGVPTSLALLPQGRHIVGDDRGRLLYFSARGEIEREVKAHKTRTSALALAPDGRRIASGGWDNTVRLWGVDGSEIWQRKDHKSAVSALAWSRDGQWLLSGSWDRRIFVRRAATGEIERTCEGHEDWVRALRVHPSRDLFLSVGDDRRLIAWDFACRKQGELRLHRDIAVTLDISADGTLAATGGRDRRVYVVRLADWLRSMTRK